ncbi:MULTISPECIES: DUF6455 family protein [Pseudooceanicola]|nr:MULTISPECIES: DUF6455 family protein [Pseudooceanicola]
MNKPLGDLKDHFWLVQRMARAVGTDLARAMDEGRLDEGAWSEMITRCRGCEAACDCKSWLEAAEREDTPREAAMPGCANARIFPEL